jgi:hypothetical protein
MLFKSKSKSKSKSNTGNDTSLPGNVQKSDLRSLYYENIAEALDLIDLEKKMQSGLETAIVYCSRN